MDSTGESKFMLWLLKEIQENMPPADLPYQGAVLRLHLLCSAYPGNGGRVALGCKGRGEALWPFVCDAQRLWSVVWEQEPRSLLFLPPDPHLAS